MQNGYKGHRMIEWIQEIIFITNEKMMKVMRRMENLKAFGPDYVQAY